MGERRESNFNIQIVHSVAEIGQVEWDTLSASRPFQSYRWYAYGERCMEDCQPIYIILSKDGKPVARETIWLLHNDQLPIASRLGRQLILMYLRRWPMLVCRSPFSSSSGLILPESPLCEEALRALASAAMEELHHQHGSFLAFDYIENEKAHLPGWPSGSVSITVADPGTWMNLKWGSFEDFLMDSKWRLRQHYKRSSREAADLGIRVTRHTSVGNINTALELIHNVEQRHNSMPNPWARDMLENIGTAESVWLEAHIGERLVGCLLLLEDNGVQIATLPGLTDDVPFAYFMLLYEAIQDAFDKKLIVLRWGSGAYETKRRLGFELEKNNNVVYCGVNSVLRLVSHLAAS